MKSREEIRAHAQKVIARLKAMTPEQRAQTFVDAGIILPNGEVAPEYGGPKEKGAGMSETPETDALRRELSLDRSLDRAECMASLAETLETRLAEAMRVAQGLADALASEDQYASGLALVAFAAMKGGVA